MTNKEKVLNELSVNIEKLAEMLIRYRDTTKLDLLPSYEYITSDDIKFDNKTYSNAFEEAVKHEIEWLNMESNNAVN